MNAIGKEDCGQHALASRRTAVAGNPWHVNGERTANVQRMTLA